MTVKEAKRIAKLECALECCKKESMLGQYVSDEKWKYFDVAAKAIDKQIPKKPDYEDNDAECPVCGHEFENNYNDWGCAFCQDCGQALDWSDSE